MNLDPVSSMKVLMAKVEFFFPFVHSLKEKRQILRKVKDRLFASYHVTIHEVSHQDKWQRALLGFALVGNDATNLSSVGDKILDTLVEYGLGEIVETAMEVVDF